MPDCPRSPYTNGDHCFCRPAEREILAGAVNVILPVPLAICCGCGATREVGRA
jgi:hypothetical protein